jgi:sugar lactone lactonase YvrE
MPADSTVRCVADVQAVLGEGPVWVAPDAALYWVDIKGRKIFRLDANNSMMQWETPVRVGSIAPRTAGGFLAGTDEGIMAIDLESRGFELLFNPEPNLPDNRFNDGKVDRRGSFWAGTMDDRERQACGSLYRIGHGLDCTKMDAGYKVTNGPAFSPDGRTVYHNDSARQITYRFDVDEGGDASNRRTFLKFNEGDGYPDGMTVDAEGCLWIAFWDGWCVRRFSRAGELLLTIEVPTARPTSCAFGGAQLERLYITSARVGLAEADLAVQPNAGGLFMTLPGVPGIADVPFAG